MKKELKAVMGRVAGATGIVGRHFRSKMTIVAFHRVNDRFAADGLTCSSAKFEAFCGYFRKHFRVVPLAQQVADCRAGRAGGGTLSITFDDGYLDNFEIAAPILRRLGLPATFFVASAFIGSNRVPAWDRHLTPHPGWMSWDNVRTLAAQGFEIGCHTHNHINLATSDVETVRTDLRVSRSRIAEELEAPVRHFAYPFGGREDISERALETVRECGFESCVSCFGGVNSVPADPYRLKRIGIAEWFATPYQLAFELIAQRA